MHSHAHTLTRIHTYTQIRASLQRVQEQFWSQCGVWSMRAPPHSWSTWLIHMCDMTYSQVWRDSCICVTWLIHMCDMTHPYVWRDLFICVTWLMWSLVDESTSALIVDMNDMNMNKSSHTYDKSSHTYEVKSHIRSHVTHMNTHRWYDLFTCVTRLIHMCDMTYSQMWHDLFICVTWLIHMCDITHVESCRWPNKVFICVTCCIRTWHDTLIHIRHAPLIQTRHDSYMWLNKYASIAMCAFDMMHSYAWHNSCIYVTVCDMTHLYVCHNACICVTVCEVPGRMHMCVITHAHVWHDACTCVTVCD